MNNSRYSLGADKRIKSSDVVSYTLRKGQRKASGTIRVHYLPSMLGGGEESNLSIAAFIVPKRLYRKASQRNQVRRWIKEAYRLNQEILINSSASSYRLIFIVQKKGIANYHEVERSIIQLLEYLSNIQSTAKS